MLRVTVERVDEKLDIYAILVQDPLPERGRPLNKKILMTAKGLEALVEAGMTALSEKDKNIFVKLEK
jgi:hypothetical protein